jgi:hypothetical protein
VFLNELSQRENTGQSIAKDPQIFAMALRSRRQLRQLG